MDIVLVKFFFRIVFGVGLRGYLSPTVLGEEMNSGELNDGHGDKGEARPDKVIQSCGIRDFRQVFPVVHTQEL